MPVTVASVAPPAMRPPAELLASADWRVDYRPLFRQGDMQTIVGRYWPGSLDAERYPERSRLFDTEPATKVLARINAQPGDAPDRLRPTVLAVHGLTACDRASYMLRAARAALGSGFDAVRLNVRNCGGTEHLCQTLYHSGLTVDLRKVVEALAPRPLFILGYSMGGNMALKLAGEWGASPPAHVKAICAVSPPVQLAACSRNIGKRRNFVYEQRFLYQLAAALRRKSAAMPGILPEWDMSAVRSIWDFDEHVTAPAFGFRDAADYYAQCSAAGYVGSARVPTLIIQAQDDPFIPFEAFDLGALRDNPWIVLLAPPHGGHVAFMAKGGRRFWCERQAMSFFSAMGASK